MKCWQRRASLEKRRAGRCGREIQKPRKGGAHEQTEGDRLSWTGCGRQHNEIFYWSFLRWQQVPCLLVHFSPELWDHCGKLWRPDLDLCFSYSKFFLQHCPSTLFWQQSSIYSGIFIQISLHCAALPPEYASSGYAAGNAGIVSPTWPSWRHGKILVQRIKYWLYKFRTGQNICRCQTCRCWTCFSAAETKSLFSFRSAPFIEDIR